MNAEASQRFLTAAVRSGLLPPAVARELLTLAAASGRPAWELARERGALSEEALAAAWRAAQAMSSPTHGASTAAHEDSAGTLVAAPLPSSSSSIFAPARGLEVVDELGAGGMGRVLRARDLGVGREVAKKVLLEEHAQVPAHRERFLDEARVTGQLEHPNIVPVYEVGADPTGEPYFVMKLVRGRSLADVVRATRDDPQHPAGQVAPLLRQFLKICEAIAYAHDRGVVHRDLKPANVMVGDFGEVLVMDWGLARVHGQKDEASVAVRRASETAADRTQDGAILGTPAYMPPEQAEGRRDAIDARSDVYSLGAILYELLALRAPFVGATATNIIKQVLLDAPTRPSAVAPPGRVVARELEAVALKALGKEPGDRYASAQELALEVTRFLDGRPVEALPIGPARRALKWAARHAELTAAVTGGLVLALAVAGGAGFALASKERERHRLAEERAGALERERAADAARERAEQEKRAAEQAGAEEKAQRLAAAQRRAEAMIPYLKVADLVGRNLSGEDVRAHVIPELERACDLDPSFVEAHLALGRAYLYVERAAEAARSLERADAVAREAGAPGSPRALFLLGQLAEGHEVQAHAGVVLAPAREYFARCLAVDPADPYARIASVYLEPDPGRALAAAEALVREVPYLSDAFNAYAFALQRTSSKVADASDRAQLERSVALLTRAIELAQPAPAERGRLFELFMNRGAIRGTLAQLDPAFRASAIDDFRRAEPHLEAIPFDLTHAQFHSSFGHTLLEHGDEAEGLRHLDLALARRPTHVRSALMKGHHLLSRDRAAEALAALEPATLHARDSDLEGVLLLSHIVAAAEAGEPARADRSLERLPAAPQRPPELFSTRLAATFSARVHQALGGMCRSRRERFGANDQVAASLEASARAGAARANEAAGQALRAGDHARALGEADAALNGLDAYGLAEPAARLNLLGARATAAFSLGRHADAARDLEECLRLNDASRPDLRVRAAFDSYNLAVARANLQPLDREAVLGALERAAQLGFDRASLVRGQQALAPLLDDPRMKAVLSKMMGR